MTKQLFIRGLFSAFILFISLFGVAQPSITSFSPTSGPIGTTVTINGSNFSTTPANNIVFFGAVKANVTAATVNSLTVIVPSGAAYQPVSVTVSGSVAYSNQYFLTTFSGGGSLIPESFPYAGRADSVVNIETNDMQTGDIDGDGLLDLAMVDKIGAKLSVYRNLTNGGVVSFGPRMEFQVGAAPQDIMFGDIDGDGKLDLVISNRESSSISIFRNTSTSGSISFSARIDFITPNFPSTIAINDLDKDGKPDIAIGCFAANGTLTTFRNTSTPGTISLATRVDIVILSIITKMASADIDGDNKPDIVFSDFIANTLVVLRNTSTIGSITYATKVTFATPQTPFGIAVGDIDGDGKHDVGVAAFDGNVATVFRNTSTAGNISFADHIDFPSNTGPNRLAFGDLDGNGKADMAVLDDDPNTTVSAFSVFINTSTIGSISFNPKFDYPTVGYERILINDMDGDGKSDIIVAGSLFRTLIWKNKVGEPQISSFTPTTAGPGTTITISGVNLSGVTAVSFGGVAASSFTVVNSNTVTAVVAVGASGNVSITTPRGIASLAGFIFTTTPIITSFTPTVGGPGSVITISGANLTGASAVSFGGIAAASFNVVSPSTITAVVASGASGSVSVTVPSGSPSANGFVFTNTVTINGFSPVSGLIGTNVTISGANFSSNPANNIVYFGDVKASVLSSSPGLLVAVVPPGSSYKPITVTTNGLTAFSKLPFVVTIPGTTNITTGAFAPKVDYPLGSVGSYGVETGDLDNDGKTDFYATQFDANRLSMFKNTSSGGIISFAAKIDSVASGQPTTTGMADFDGDGKKDLIVINFNVSVFKNNGSSGTISLFPKIGFSAGGLPENFSVGDLTPDGKPDIAIANGSQLEVLSNNTSTAGSISFAPAVQFNSGNQPQSVVIGDLNDDGKSDMAIVNQSSGTLSVFTNTSTASTLSFAPQLDFTTGIKPYSVALGDLNADGKPEVVLTNFESNTVSVYRNTSVNGVVSFATREDIATGSQPRSVAIGDMNGDGKPDMIVVNALSSSISVYQNMSSGSTISFPSRIDFSTAGFPQYVSLADFDGDGKLDISVAGYSGAAVAIHRNTINELTIHSFSPANGTTGTEVTISGNNFTGATSVRFGSVNASSFTVNSSTSITAIVGTGANGDVTVTTPLGTASKSGFTYYLAPTITSFTPVIGGGGTSVSITGTNFTGATAVRIGGVLATSFIVNSSTSITAIVGGGGPGSVTVTVTTPGGTATSQTLFQYYPYPSISSFNPTSGTSGTVVTILGPNYSFTGFQGVTNVSFGGIPASSFTVVDNRTITAIVGPGASGNVSVTSPGGTAFLSAFTYLATPTPIITSFTPNTGAAGTTITITGTNFTGATSVSFGGVAATSFAVVNPTTITAVVGTGATGIVSVTTPGGTATKSGFTFSTVTAVIDPSSVNSAELTVNPNPGDGIVLIKHPASLKGASLQFYDELGRLVKEYKVNRNNAQTEVDVSGFSPAIYYIVWRDDKRKLSRVFMVN